MSKKQQTLMHNNLELLCDIVLKALFAKWFESQLKKIPMVWNSEKRLLLMYLLVTRLKIVFTMFVAYVQHQSAKNSSNWSSTAVCFGSFIQTSGCGVN